MAPNPPPAAAGIESEPALDTANAQRIALLEHIREWRAAGHPDHPKDFTFEVRGAIDESGKQYYELYAIDFATGFEIDFGCFAAWGNMHEAIHGAYDVSA